MQERCHTYPAFYLGTPEYKEPLDLRVHVQYRMLYCSANTLILAFVVAQLKYIQEAFCFRDPCILSHQHLVREMYSAFFSLSPFFSLKCYMMPFNLLYSLEGAKVDFLWISMQFELFCSISASRVCQGHKSWDTKRCSQLSYAIFPEGRMHTQGMRYIS